MLIKTYISLQLKVYFSTKLHAFFEKYKHPHNMLQNDKNNADEMTN